MATRNHNLSKFDAPLPSAEDMRFGIVVAEWNREVTEALLEGAVRTLRAAGCPDMNIQIKYVPGTFELSLGAQFFAEYTDVDAVIALGCVIQGDTRHFDFICQGVTQGITQLQIQWNMPIAFGVLTVNDMQQALDRAVANGVKNLVVQPTHLMHGAEYDEMMEMIDTYRDKFESVAVAEPLLGEVGSDATIINQDKEDVAKAVTAAAVKEAGYDSLDAAAADKTAFVFMGHGTSHTAKVSYSQMQTTMQTLGYDNVFIGTVEGEPEETACENVIEAVKAAGYTKVILRPLMVVAGDHANNDMAGADDDSWLSQFQASGDFASVECQIAGLGEIEDIQQRYIEHTKAAIDSLNG